MGREFMRVSGRLYIVDHSLGIKEVWDYLQDNHSEDFLKYVFYIHVKDANFRGKSLKSYLIDKFTSMKNLVINAGIMNLYRTYLFRDGILLLEQVITPSYLKFFRKIVFINHGWGTKKSPGNIEVKDESRMFYYRELLQHCTEIICLSDFDSTYFLVHPLLTSERRPKFLPLGLPRNDYLVRNKENEGKFKLRIKEEFQIKGKDKIILYAPTHREKKEFDEPVLSNILKEFDGIDYLLGNKDIKILFRPHYYISGLESEMKKYRNIFYAGADKFRDPRPLLLGCDYLLTDYSSIFVDYLLLQKPIIFYPFDLDQYNELRGLVIDFNNKVHTPGPKIRKLEELLELNYLDFKEFDLERSLYFFYKYPDGKATERLVNFLIEKLQKGD